MPFLVLDCRNVLIGGSWVGTVDAGTGRNGASWAQCHALDGDLNSPWLDDNSKLAAVIAQIVLLSQGLPISINDDDVQARDDELEFGRLDPVGQGEGLFSGFDAHGPADGDDSRVQSNHLK